MRAAIIGCGLIGGKRAKAFHGSIAVCCDLNESRAAALAKPYRARSTADWVSVVGDPDVDVVFVATTHDSLPTIAEAAAANGKHVLIEKPGARRACELDAVAAAAKRSGARIRVGFNHRYHRAFRKAREIFESGALGDLMFIRARYGHGGRVGYDREWRAGSAK